MMPDPLLVLFMVVLLMGGITLAVWLSRRLEARDRAAIERAWRAVDHHRPHVSGPDGGA